MQKRKLKSSSGSRDLAQKARSVSGDLPILSLLLIFIFFPFLSSRRHRLPLLFCLSLLWVGVSIPPGVHDNDDLEPEYDDMTARATSLPSSRGGGSGMRGGRGRGRGRGRAPSTSFAAPPSPYVPPSTLSVASSLPLASSASSSSTSSFLSSSSSLSSSRVRGGAVGRARRGGAVSSSAYYPPSAPSVLVSSIPSYSVPSYSRYPRGYRHGGGAPTDEEEEKKRQHAVKEAEQAQKVSQREESERKRRR